MFEAYKNDIYENVASGLWLDVELGLPTDGEPNDKDMLHILSLSSNRFLDPDDDGYAEPYIVTVHKETHEVVRDSCPRFEPENVEIRRKPRSYASLPAQYFTAFQFLPGILMEGFTRWGLGSW